MTKYFFCCYLEKLLEAFNLRNLNFYVDMIDLKIARNYASSLFDNIKSDADRQKVLEQISAFNQVLLNSKKLSFILYSPLVFKSDKIKLIENLVNELKLEEIITRFFKIIVKNSRFEILESVVNEYRKLLNESKRVKLVTLEFAVKPNKKLVNMIREYLENKLSKTVEFNVVENESLIGGVVIKHDSLLYDYSIAGALDRAARLAKLAKLESFTK
jgi:F-type H+-transporting ATPase subunit delta